MAAPSPKNAFHIHILDIPLAQRAKHFAAHIERLKPFVESGAIIAAGALLPDGVVMSDPSSVERRNGSVVFLRAETAEEVWEILKNDPFYTSGEVWDISSIKVTPIMLGVPSLN
ncbi:hypothetical protein C8Q80DRAFT_1097556 [Daedaleopsis nitida]|nr:hypothetical protein C8Q80DRAFT_1097556 [Daedaleopsis nitida]